MRTTFDSRKLQRCQVRDGEVCLPRRVCGQWVTVEEKAIRVTKENI